MITVKGRRKCCNCGKRYNYCYAKKEEDIKKVKFKGKDENAAIVTDVKVLSAYSYELTVICPECGTEEKIIYTE